jgi:hypothetical protein
MASSAAELPGPSQAAVNAAIAAPFIRYSRTYSGGAHTNGAYFGGASIALAVASYAGNTTADARLLAQIRDTLVAGHEPTCNGGYPTQHEKHVTGMFVIVKHTPRIWDQLSSSEKTKIDRIMKATLYASAFTTSDNNPFIKSGTQQYTLDGDSNVDRGWNPNYREGMIGGMLVGMAYFGGPAATEAILSSYNHSQFLVELNSGNLPNAYETFNWKAAHASSGAPSASQIETAVRTYRYFSMTLADYMDIYEDLVAFTYSRNVNAGLNNGAGINGYGKIASGAATLPNPGAPGMFREFDGNDANGSRSSLIYAFEGYRPALTNQLSLIVAGFWQKDTPITSAAVALMNIGNTDLWYKAEKGYHSYAKGASQGYQDFGDFGTSRGFIYNRSLWDDVLKPYHDLPGGGDPPPSGFAIGSRVESGASAMVHGAASAEAVLTGLLPAGSRGTLVGGPVGTETIEWWQADFDNGVSGWIRVEDISAAPASVVLTSSPLDVWKNLAIPPQSGSFTVSFNMTASSAGTDGVTGLSASSASDYSQLAVIVRFASSGVVDARNGGAYQAANSLVYQPGVTYRVRLTVNVPNHTYSATVTPAGGSPVVIASNYAFRNGQSSVSSLANLAAVATISGSHTVSEVSLGADSTPPSKPSTPHKE